MLTTLAKSRKVICRISALGSHRLFETGTKFYQLSFCYSEGKLNSDDNSSVPNNFTQNF